VSPIARGSVWLRVCAQRRIFASRAGRRRRGRRGRTGTLASRRRSTRADQSVSLHKDEQAV